MISVNYRIHCFHRRNQALKTKKPLKMLYNIYDEIERLSDGIVKISSNFPS